MCGRYVSPDEVAIERMWHLGRDSPNPFAELMPFGRRYNVTPTTKVAVIQWDRDKEQLVLSEARWI
jgi:putative SOS response-associated peptidase YedK